MLSLQPASILRATVFKIETQVGNDWRKDASDICELLGQYEATDKRQNIEHLISRFAHSFPCSTQAAAGSTTCFFPLFAFLSNEVHKN